MFKYSFTAIVAGLVLVGCASKKSSCACPYQSAIDIKVSDLNTDLHLALSADTIKFQQFSFAEIATPDLVDFVIQEEGNTYNPLSTDIIKTALNYKGVRYRRGGVSTSGMDCSGLVYKCFSSFGISLPRSSADMAKAVAEVSRKDVQEGDLIFFRTNRKHNRINHVGLVIEVNGRDIKFIHASSYRGVVVSSTQEAYYTKTYAKIGRVLHS